jgi:phosphatidylinositol glycan class O
VKQLKNYNKTSAFLGDDTWEILLPKMFDISYPFPSFDVFDFKSVDDGIKAKIFETIEFNHTNLLIGTLIFLLRSPLSGG